MTHKGSFVKGALCGALLTFLVVILVGGAGYLWLFGTGSAINTATEQKIQAMRHLIETEYLYSDQIDEAELQEALMKGYVSGLGDPYSVYYDKEETQELLETTSGKFVGIGVVIAKSADSDIYTFTTVYEGSPAQKAGMKDGDILKKVDGEDVAGLDLDTIVSRIKGKRGTVVQLVVMRGEDEALHTLDIVRDKVEINTVTYEMKDEAIGYIYVSGFEEVTYKQFADAIADLEAQGMKGLVIDLRDNPGGNFDTVCDMLDLILPEGVIISTKDKNGKGQVVKSDAEHVLRVPMSVLVNGNSASASEVFAGAVQDYGVGKIVGTTTFGKGIVQQLYQLIDGTCLKLTTSEYFTPHGRNIHGVGITPDVEVELIYDEVEPTKDTQLEKAIEILKNNE